MANNRMFLQYRPTGELVYLGKRMNEGWYDVPERLSESIVKLFERAEASAGNLDDFVLALEQPCNEFQAESPDTMDGLIY